MIKYFCDICEEEVSCKDDLSKINITKPMFPSTEIEICDCCLEKIKDFVKVLEIISK